MCSSPKSASERRPLTAVSPYTARVRRRHSTIEAASCGTSFQTTTVGRSAYQRNVAAALGTRNSASGGVSVCAARQASRHAACCRALVKLSGRGCPFRRWSIKSIGCRAARAITVSNAVSAHAAPTGERGTRRPQHRQPFHQPQGDAQRQQHVGARNQ